MKASHRRTPVRTRSLLLPAAVMICASLCAPTVTAADGAVANATAEMLVVSSPAPEADQDLLDKLAATLAANHVETDKFDAQVWLMASESRLARYMDDKAARLALLQLVYREAHRTGLDPDLVLAVMQVESHFDRYAISRVGAQGLMQIMPATARELGLRDAFDPRENVRAGTRYLKRMIRALDGELDLSLIHISEPTRLDLASRMPSAA